MRENRQQFMNFVQHATSTTMSNPAQLLGLDDPRVHVDIRVKLSDAMIKDGPVSALRRLFGGGDEFDHLFPRV